VSGPWRAELGRVAAVAWKDLTAERRTRANANAVLFFAVLVLVLFGFAFGPDADALRVAAPGVLWLTVLFSGVLAFNRSYQVELENGAFDVLLLYPGDRRAIFLGKVVANLVFVLLIEALVVPLAALLYGLPLLAALPGLAAVVLLATLGLVTVGTFYGAMGEPRPGTGSPAAVAVVPHRDPAPRGGRRSDDRGPGGRPHG